MVVQSTDEKIIKNFKELSAKCPVILKKNVSDCNSLKKKIDEINKKITSNFSCDEKTKVGLVKELDDLINEYSGLIGNINKNLENIKANLVECKIKISKISAPLSPEIIFSEFQKNGVSDSLKEFISNRKNTKKIIQEFCTVNNIPVKIAPLKKDLMYDAILTQIIDIYSI